VGPNALWPTQVPTKILGVPWPTRPTLQSPHAPLIARRCDRRRHIYDTLTAFRPGRFLGLAGPAIRPMGLAGFQARPNEGLRVQHAVPTECSNKRYSNRLCSNEATLKQHY